MATRKKSSRKRQPKTNPLQSLADALTRPGFVGALLVLVSVFTLLSLISGSNGSLTGAWVAFLRRSVGVGVWALPLVTGGIGLWLVIGALEQMPAPPWRRPLGLLLLFAAFITGASLLLPAEVRVQIPAGEAGGQAGTAFATLLESTITLAGAWALVAFFVVSGIIFLTDRLLIDGTQALVAALQEWSADRRMQRVQRAGEPSLWNRLRARVARLGRQEPADFYPPLADELPANRRLVRPEPVGAPRAPVEAPERARPAPAATTAQAATAQMTAAQATAAGGAAAGQPAPTPAQAGESSILQPRIIGGAQEWRLPRLDAMLADWERRTDSDELIRHQGRLIQETLALFGVPADFEGAYKGPSVTQYLIKPGYVQRTIKGEPTRIKVKVAKIAGLANDLALALAAPSVRIEAPIPGTNYVGVEVPNRESNVVGLKELMESETYTGMKGRLKFALGEDVKGQPVVADLARMPHLLIAGATGSGKSVCINSIIVGLLLSHTPDSLRLLMVDPKMVELSVYNGVPHLLSPVVTEVDKAAGVLFWAVKEMERRYGLFAKSGARDLIRYNEFLTKKGEKPLPYIVVVVDEMADLMMAAPEEVEKHICRLAQMARATGIHLIIATQRPSVDVITGLIKANFPARIAFAVTSQVDSRVILDIPGAERLLGRGDMLFMAPDAGKLERLQGTYLSDDEINTVVRYWKGIRVLEPSAPGAPLEQGVLLPAAEPGATGDAAPLPPARPEPGGAAGTQREAPLFEQIEALKAVDGRDELFDDAVRAVREAGRGSVSLLQRKLRIGYGRAARLIEQLEEAGVLGVDGGGTLGRPLAAAASGTAPGTAPGRSFGTAPPPAGAARPRIIGGDPDDEDAPAGPAAAPSAPNPRAPAATEGAAPNIWM